MAVRSAVMERLRSTLATAAVAVAVAVAGLAVAAHVLHPGNFEELPRPARAAVAPAAITSLAKVDPSFEAYLRRDASASGIAVMAPRLTAPMPAGTTMAPILPTGLAVAVDRPREVDAPRRPETAQRVVRARTAQAVPAGVRTTLDGSSDVPPWDLALGGEV